jgi:RNA-directed DNA polymerase
MRGIRAFLEEVLRLRINEAKSAVERPWKRKFLGDSVTAHRDTRIRIAPESVRRLVNRVRERLREGRGQSLAHTIEQLNPVLRGWMVYFRKSEAKGILEELDGWVRRRLRCLLWRQWKTSRTRIRRLTALGLTPQRAWKSASNGRGPWWNFGASHMNAALPAAYFTHLGLVSLLATHRRLQRVT